MSQLVWMQPNKRVPRVIIGTLAQYDECTEPIDEATHAPVRIHGKVVAVPLHEIKMVG
ncbi:hypothetical protein [Nocardia farcinica]|uniref:hypothetical protein n=1 Tax=Nocardia farcinica TaxID=37329 RepID=UPI001895D664|nr:hypothetical protein [Nocardia farcinica]MBF6411195.1 hypothetical protein [Nocardia farcinica]